VRFSIDYYRLTNGDCPVEEFLDSLDVKMRAKLLRMVLLLEEKGNELREPFSKPLDDGIFELRSKQGTNIVRVLYFFVVGRKIVLTNGFVKKTAKTPQSEIDRAKKYRADYFRRGGAGNE
jgi:phage-related protein